MLLSCHSDGYLQHASREAQQLSGAESYGRDDDDDDDDGDGSNSSVDISNHNVTVTTADPGGCAV